MAADLIAQRAVRRARVKKGYSSEGHGKRAESREQEEHTGDKREVEGSKMPSEMPQNEPKRAKTAQNRAKGAPRRPQEEPKRGKKANPNRKTKKEPNQDDPKTVLDRPRAD